MATEFQQLIDTLKRAGIPHHVHWTVATGGKNPELRRATFQRILGEAGFAVTALNLNAVVMDDWFYVYSCSEPHWTCYEGDPEDCNGHKGWGQAGMFVFAWNQKTGQVKHREFKSQATREVVATGLAAVERMFGEFPKYTPRPA